MMEKPAKKYLGILFQCCNVYRRIYLNKEQNAYWGRCPRCYRKIQVVIGSGGSDSMFFNAK